MRNFDLIVIGGGPGGYSAAITAARSGLAVLLCEKEHLGGTCLNVGCIPTKYLLDKAAHLEKTRQLMSRKIYKDAGFYSFKKIQEQKEAAVKKLVGGVSALLTGSGVTVVKGEAVFDTPGQVRCGSEVYTAKNILIATGSKPIALRIPGAQYALDSTAALALRKVPKRLAVIGGGVIGLELASAFRSYGAEVTVLEYMNDLFPNEERNVIAYLKRALEKRGIRILCGTQVQAIEKGNGALHVVYAGGEVEADEVLMATGRGANLAGIDAEKLGLELTKKREIVVNEYMQTNLDGVYAIGDVIGGYQLAHAAYAEAETAIHRILGGNKPLDETVIPRCVYTLPPFAAVGITSQQAEKAGIATTIGKFDYAGNGMALAEDASGIVNVVMDKETRRTLGVQIVGECAPEMIAFAALAVAQKLTYEDWERTIVAHPSLSEMLREAALDTFGGSVHSMKKQK